MDEDFKTTYKNASRCLDDMIELCAQAIDKEDRDEEKTMLFQLFAAYRLDRRAASSENDRKITAAVLSLAIYRLAQLKLACKEHAADEAQDGAQTVVE